VLPRASRLARPKMRLALSLALPLYSRSLTLSPSRSAEAATRLVLEPRTNPAQFGHRLGSNTVWFSYPWPFSGEEVKFDPKEVLGCLTALQ